MTRTEIIRKKFEELLGDNPRIKARVVTISKELEGYNGTAVVLWYPHRTGIDEHREASDDDSLVVRVRRLKVSEVNVLGNLVAEAVNDFPDLEAILHRARSGEFIYYFLPK